jgi:two-component system KDP operon response regulator KdpE
METPTDKSRVLVVDDEPHLSDALCSALSTEGYVVRTVGEGGNPLTSFAEWRPQLVITDLRMAPMDGIELCRRIRAESMVPIIVMSGDDDEPSKVEALDSGADDYIVKPVGHRELMARVRAALRRTAPARGDALLEVGDFRVDFDLRRVYVRGGQVRLTPKEFDLFVYLARNPKRVIPHVRLLSAVWGVKASDHLQHLRVFMRQIRIKLENDPSKPRYLMTEPGVGYWFNPDGGS